MTTGVPDELLATLTAQARREQPRLFAICGMYEDPPVLADEDATYVVCHCMVVGLDDQIQFGRADPQDERTDGSGPARVVRLAP